MDLKMTYFYDSVENVESLGRVLSEWEGTPYRHRSGVKKMGADCIQSTAEVHREVGVKNIPTKFPDYPRDWHLHNDDELIINAMLAAQIKEIPYTGDENIKDGDILVFRWGRVHSHTGTFFKGRIYHIQQGGKFTGSPVADRNIKNRPKRIFRILA